MRQGTRMGREGKVDQEPCPPWALSLWALQIPDKGLNLAAFTVLFILLPSVLRALQSRDLSVTWSYDSPSCILPGFQGTTTQLHRVDNRILESNHLKRLPTNCPSQSHLHSYFWKYATWIINWIASHLTAAQISNVAFLSLLIQFLSFIHFPASNIQVVASPVLCRSYSIFFKLFYFHVNRALERKKANIYIQSPIFARKLKCQNISSKAVNRKKKNKLGVRVYVRYQERNSQFPFVPLMKQYPEIT